MRGVCTWLFCWPQCKHRLKSALCWAVGNIPLLSFKFAAQDLSHVRALENCYRITCSKRFLTLWNAYFWLPHFSAWKKKKKKKKAKSLWQQRWAITASGGVLILRTHTVKHVGPFLKSCYFGSNYCLDMLLHSDMNLDLLTLITNVQRHCAAEK